MYKFRGTGLNSAEKKRAQRKYNTYKKNYSIENESELVLVEELCFQEVLIDRYKVILEKVSKNKTIEEQIPPAHIKKAIDECLAQSINLKEKLKLFDNKEESDQLQEFKKLEKKAKQWREEHWDARKTACPQCGFNYFLKFDVTKYTPHESPFFENRILANRPLFEIYKKGKITAEEVGKVLGVSKDYIDTLEELFKKSNKVKNDS